MNKENSMSKPADFRELTCAQCRDGAGLEFEFTMAFQPIVDLPKKRIFAYEALARGPNGEGADFILAKVNATNLYSFDQACRVKAIQLAAELGMSEKLSINFNPNAIYKPELCLRSTLAAADTYGFDIRQIIFEFTEREAVVDPGHLSRILSYYQKTGFSTAIDDFGAGFSGLNLLSEISPNIVKLDRALIRGIDENTRKQIIVQHIVAMARQLNTKVIAEGIETQGEADTLSQLGIGLLQGYFFAKPAIARLTNLVIPNNL